MLSNNRMCDIVNITAYNNIKCRYHCNDIEGYNNYLKDHPDMCEMIGEYGQQIKPVFDVDAYNNDINIDEVINEINKIFPNKEINYAKREPREYKNKGVKYSYRFYVKDVRITSKNLKQLCINNKLNENPIFDMSIYTKNRVLLLPLTTFKMDTKHNLYQVPKLNPINCDIFDCCASYIKEDYEDWDIKINPTIENKQDLKTKLTGQDVLNKIMNNEDINLDEDDDNNKYLKLQKIIPMLSEKRSSNFDDWLNVFFALVNIGNKENINKDKVVRLIHQFSQLSKSNYNEDKVDEWINDYYNKVKEGYGWNFIYQVCLKEDNPDYYENLTLSYFNVKEEFEKTRFKCEKPVCFIEINNNITDLDDEPFITLNKNELKIRFENLYCVVKTTNKKGETKYTKKSFIDLWLKDAKIRTYKKLLFTPQKLNQDDSKLYYNTFSGFKASKLPIYKDYDIIQPILNHIETVLCNGNKDYANWILQYLAQIIQNPINKTDTIIVLKGNQGCGKNILFDNFADKIIGSDYSISTGNAERHLLGGFNSSLFNKLFAVCNEIGNDMRGLMDKLKDLATTPNIQIEKKGKDPMRNPNYINIVMTTNNNNPLDIAEDDRRICWLHCNPCYVGNVEYFKILGDCFNNDKVISSFYHYLKEEVKINITNFQVSRPITKEYQAIKRLNNPNYIKFLIDYAPFIKYRCYKNIDNHVIKCSKLYEEYVKWCEKCRFTAFNKSQFDERITTNTGIYKCIYEGNKSFRFIKNEVNEYLSKHNDDIEIFEDDYIDNEYFED
jgi:hypothetical protein